MEATNSVAKLSWMGYMKALGIITLVSRPAKRHDARAKRTLLLLQTGAAIVALSLAKRLANVMIPSVFIISTIEIELVHTTGHGLPALAYACASKSDKHATQDLKQGYTLAAALCSENLYQLHEPTHPWDRNEFN